MTYRISLLPCYCFLQQKSQAAEKEHLVHAPPKMQGWLKKKGHIVINWKTRCVQIFILCIYPDILVSAVSWQVVFPLPFLCE